MTELNKIGLKQKQAQKLSQKLNQLLADYQVFYMNARGFHWNIQGKQFFELHLKFEELYNDLLLKVDEVAERILTLGETPLHSFEDYLKTSRIKAVKETRDAKDTVESVLNSFQTLLIEQRKLLTLAAEASDEGTSAMMSDYIREQEKLVWMYSSYLK